MYSKDFNFSFSGLKTAVLYLVRDLLKEHKLEEIRSAVAHEAQEAIVEVLVHKAVKAAEKYKVKSIMLSGGVSANKRLRERLQVAGDKLQIPVFIPPLQYTTDNAAMIALAGYMNAKSLKLKANTWQKVKANANWEIL